MINRQVVTIAEIPPADPRVSSEYITAKYKEWLKRRGLTDPAFREELERMEKRSFSFKKRNKK